MKGVNWFYSGCVVLVLVIYWATNTWPITILFNLAELALAQDENWWQGWISATSGWAAFAAAVVTTVILLKQLSEQRRQTAFILGDETPSLDSIQDSKDAEKIVLRIVNWNRRSFKPETIEIPNTGLAIAMHSVDINGAPVYKSIFYIDGWVDRSRSPKVCTFSVKVADKTPENTYQYLQDFPSTTEIIVRGVLLGERHKRVELRCFLHP